MTAETINYTTIDIQSSKKNPSFFLSEEDDINVVLQMIKAVQWRYFKKELEGGYYFDPIIQCTFYLKEGNSVTINLLRQRLYIYATVESKEKYGTFILEETEGQKLIDYLMELESNDFD